ncbi:protein bark beetle-like [Branchiostoma floridae x Branchiostoma belcheri]
MTMTGNNGGCVYIRHSYWHTRGSYNMTNLTCEGNRGIGVKIQLSYESSVDISNSRIQGNRQGGVSVIIESYRHDGYPQITMTNNTVANNTRFALQATGKLANFEISSNSIIQTSCPYQPAVAFKGQPKYINFSSNKLIQNNARETLSVLFEDQSQTSEKVTVHISDNVFNDNFYSPSETDGNFQYGQYIDLTSCTIEIGGLKENYTVIRNLINDANMNHTLCSRVGTTHPDETIDAKYNWWGTMDEQEIRNRIVDYDDWNDRAPVDYFPYLTEPDVNSQPADPYVRNINITTDNIEGRLNGALHLTKSGSPYTIKKDLTILENASVTVEPGVQIRFHPCVGIFNLGSFVAVGTEAEQIEFHSEPSATHLYNVRLVNGRYPWEGRVEILYDNQWGGICFGSRWWVPEANVVCRELGYGAPTTTRTHAFGRESGPAWYRSSYITCNGDELSITNCLPNSPSPATCSDRIGIRCDPQTPVSPRPMCIAKKWGGIRCNSQQEFEVKHAVIAHTGRLHARLSSAILLNSSEISRSISNVHIKDCQGSGINGLGKSTYDVTNLTISNCHGEAGISFERVNKMATVTNSFIYNNTFHEGAIAINATPRMSPTEMTNVQADTRCGTPLVFSNSSATFASPNFGTSLYPTYMYSYCEWLIQAPKGHVILLDFLVLNLRYGTQVMVYDGHDTTSSSLATYHRNSHPSGVTIVSSGNNMFIFFKKWYRYSGQGFLATYKMSIPIVYKIVNNIFNDNCRTAVKITAQAPDCTIDILRNIFENTQEQEPHNHQAVISVTHGRSNVLVRGNVLQNNRMTAILLDVNQQKRGNLTVIDNMFRWNHISTILLVRGQYYSRKTTVLISNNFFSGNDASEICQVLLFDKAPGRVEKNTFVNNSARHVIEWNNRYDSQEQELFNNFIYDNVPLVPGVKYTMVVSGRNAQIHGNVFMNPAFDAELATSTRLWNYPVNATSNFWGFNSAHLISRRIRDSDDRHNWAQAFYDPWLAALPADGPCPLGWKYSKHLSTCYMYNAGSEDWFGAAHSCKIQRAVIARSFLGKELELIESMIRTREIHFAPDVPTWKDKPDLNTRNSSHKCKLHLPSNGALKTFADCDSLYPFICKRPIVEDCPNACSRHGGCFLRTCICERGWEGEDCSKPNCKERNDCGEFGTCVGPNICKCRNGWQGRACTVSYCNRFTSCKSCSMAVGCGWCDQRQRCESGLYRGPDVMPCNTWFYHSCFTVGETEGCSRHIDVVDCEHRQCNKALSTTTVESCLRCQDVEGCFKETVDGFCKVWNEDQCPKGFIHPLYNDTTRIEKILIGHNVEYVPLEGNILYRCPVRFSSWGATMFVNEGDLDIRIGQVLSSPQANGVLHKVEQVIKTDGYTVIVAHPATLEDMLDYSDFSQEVQLEMAVDMRRNEGAPELSEVERVLSGNGTLDGSPVHVIKEDTPVYKCIGSRAMNEGEGSYHLLMRDIPVNLSVGDVIVSNHSNGILEQVTQQTTTKIGVFIQTQLQDCFSTFNFREELVTTDGVTLTASLPCSGGPEGAHGLLIVDSAGREVDLETGDVVVGRRSGRLLAKVLDITTVAEFMLLEVEPVLSTSRMERPSIQLVPGDVSTSPDMHSLNILMKDQFLDVNDKFNITLSTSGELTTGIKFSLGVSTSEFRTPTLKKAETFFIGGRLEVGMQGSLIVSKRTQTKGDFRMVLSPSYVSVCVGNGMCIPAKIWADIATSYKIYAEGPGSIQMSSTVTKPDIDGGGFWQPQGGAQWFSFDQKEGSGSADIVISSYSGTATRRGHTIQLELKIKPTFFIEFPTSGESGKDANMLPSVKEATA